MTDEDSGGPTGADIYGDIKAVISEDWGELWSGSVRVITQRVYNEQGQFVPGNSRFASWSGLCRLRDDGLLCVFTDGPWEEFEYDRVKSTRATLSDELPIEDHLDHLNLDGTPYMWGLLGTWEMATVESRGKVLKGTSPGLWEPVEAFRIERGWTWPLAENRTMDYTVQADVKVESSNAAAGVCLRVEETALGRASYGCLLDASQDVFVFVARYWNGSYWVWGWLDWRTVPDPTNQWHTIAVKALGHRFECYLDGQLKFTVPDESSWWDGGVGLWVENGVLQESGSALFDNVMVVDLRQ